MTKNMTYFAIRDTLRGKGFRVTESKLKLLELLKKKGTPLSVQTIATSWIGKAPNQVTLYRSLSDLAAAGIVKRVDLNTGVAHFEYTPDKPHHHHIVCTACGTVEDFEECSMPKLEDQLLRKSERFDRITSHNLELFGLCNRCA